MKIFKGCCTALATPFLMDGNVDFNSMGKLIDFQINNGIDGILVCGTTGEACTLNDDEHIEVLKFCKERIDKRVPFIAGTGSNDTMHAVFMSEQAEKAGADALLLVTPYYNKCSEKGLYQHYKTIASKTSLPIIIYNVPKRTGVDMKPSLVKKLSEIENITAIKEASGSLEKAKEIKELCGSDFAVYSGNDDIAIPIMDLGGEGVISVTSNILPKECSQMTRAFLSGQKETAYKISAKLENINKLLFKDVNPIPIKACLYLMGISGLNYRLPLCPPDDMLMEELKKELIRLEVIK